MKTSMGQVDELEKTYTQKSGVLRVFSECLPSYFGVEMKVEYQKVFELPGMSNN